MLAERLAAWTRLSTTVSQLFEPQLQNIAILRTPAFIFCLPWGRPCGNHGKSCMNEKNLVLAKPRAACTHLSLTVSQLFELQVQKIAAFTYRSPHFCFTWRRPCDYHAMCSMDGMKDNSMLVKPLAVCTYLSSIVSELYDA